MQTKTASQLHPFVRDFQQSMERDRAFIKPWLVSWAYQDQRKRRSKTYEEGLPQDFYQFNGPQDLGRWVNWNMSFPHPDYFLDDQATELIEISAKKDMEVFQQAGINISPDAYKPVLGRSNMQDYRLAHFYPTPERQVPQRVLDFGSGYGRQANLWTQCSENLSFLSMDAIPKSYCLQRYYYSLLDYPVKEYMENPEGFSIDFDPAIYHLPTWRFDLIPDNSLDMVMCIQVLPELSAKLVKYVVKEFHRILKPGGALFIRDGATWLRTGGGFVFRNHLAANGWVLEFRPHVIDPKDMHGVTRIWRKEDQRVGNAKKMTTKETLNRWYMHLDSMTGGTLGKIIRKVT